MTLEILIGSENDLGFILIPFILYIYLQNCNEDHINGLTADINKILDKGVSLHKMVRPIFTFASNLITSIDSH